MTFVHPYSLPERARGERSRSEISDFTPRFTNPPLHRSIRCDGRRFRATCVFRVRARPEKASHLKCVLGQLEKKEKRERPD